MQYSRVFEDLLHHTPGEDNQTLAPKEIQNNLTECKTALQHVYEPIQILRAHGSYGNGGEDE